MLKKIVSCLKNEIDFGPKVPSTYLMYILFVTLLLTMITLHFFVKMPYPQTPNPLWLYKTALYFMSTVFLASLVFTIGNIILRKHTNDVAQCLRELRYFLIIYSSIVVFFNPREFFISWSLLGYCFLASVVIMCLCNIYNNYRKKRSLG